MNQIPSTPEIDSSMAVRLTRPARRQHCRGHLRLFHKMHVYLLPACPTTQHQLPRFRAHGHLRRLSHILMVQYRRREPASPARSPQHGSIFDEGNTRLARRSHRPWSEFGERHPRSQRRSPQPRHRFGDGGTRFKRHTPQPWQGSQSFTRRPPPATRRAALRLLRRRVDLQSRRVHRLVSLTIWWRSV